MLVATTRFPVLARRHAAQCTGVRPQPFTLLGEAIVLFLDAQGGPAALRDRCPPHRQSCQGLVRQTPRPGLRAWPHPVRLPRLDVRPWRQGHPHSAVRRKPCGAAGPQDPGLPLHGALRLCLGALDEPIADIPDIPEFSNPAWRTIFQFYETGPTQPDARAGELV